MFDSTAGQAKEKVDITEEDVQKMKEAGTLVIDNGRRRPLYFDGRFLAASDLSMEQEYFISRQSSFGKALGGGVVEGLLVEEDPGDARGIQITAGHGLTRAGEMVLLAEDNQVSLTDVAESQRLNVDFGLSEIPKPPVSNRSGLFIIALRPVEYTAHPIAVYPTSVTGKPANNSSTATGEVITQDGDIVSAVAVVLIPYQDLGTTSELLLRRATAAREVFIEGKEKGLAAGVLPLAMIALEYGIIRWIDNDMVRRLVGNEHRDILGLGFAPRGLREAYFRQYEGHLRYILNTVGQFSTKRLSASDYFFALPACGPMPTSSINPDDFTQSFFPAEMEVDLSIIPDDELAPLIEESLLLPPIDLSLSGEDFESTSIMVLIPVSRTRLRALSAELSSVSRELKTAAPGQNAKKNPLESLYELTRKTYKTPSLLEGVIGEDAWRQLLTEHEILWYMRRRNISFRAEIASLPVSGSGSATPGDTVPPEEPPVTDPLESLNLPKVVMERIELLDLADDVTRLAESSNAVAKETLSEFLSMNAFRDVSDVIFYAAINDLGSASSSILRPRNSAITITGKGETISSPQKEGVTNIFGKTKSQITAEWIKKVWKRFDYENMGKGISKLEQHSEKLKGKVYLANLGKSNYVPEFDQALFAIKEPEYFQEVAEKSVEVILDKEPDQYLKVAEFIQEIIEGTKKPEKEVIVPETKEKEKPAESSDKTPVKERPIVAGDKELTLEEKKIIEAGEKKKIAPELIASDDSREKTKPKNIKDAKASNSLEQRLETLNLTNNYEKLIKIATNASVRNSLQNFLSSTLVNESQNIVLVAILDELSRAAKKANNRVSKAVMAAIDREFDHEEIGVGIARLEKLEPALLEQTDYYNVLGRSSMIPQLASLALSVEKKSELKKISSGLLELLVKESTKKLSNVQSFIRQSMKEHNVKAK